MNDKIIEVADEIRCLRAALKTVWAWIKHQTKEMEKVNHTLVDDKSDIRVIVSENTQEMIRYWRTERKYVN